MKLVIGNGRSFATFVASANQPRDIGLTHDAVFRPSGLFDIPSEAETVAIIVGNS